MAEVDPGELEAAMLGMLEPDTETVRSAEAFIKGCLARTRCAGALVQLLSGSDAMPVRQMSGLFLRSRVNRYWSRIPPEAREEIKTLLLTRLAVEPERLVRRAIATVVAALAKHLVPGGAWPELLDFMGRATSHSSVSLRETAMLLFYYMAETIGRFISDHFDTVSGLLQAGLSDGDQAVRVMALRATTRLMSGLATDENVLAFQELVPLVMNVTQQCVEAFEEQMASEAMGVVAELAESAVPVLNAHIKPVLEFACAVLAHTELDITTRDAAAEVIIHVVDTRPRLVGKSGVVPQILETLHAIMLEYDPEAEAAAAEEDTAGLAGLGVAASAVGGGAGGGGSLAANLVTTTEIAERVLDPIAIRVKNSVVFTPACEIVAGCAADGNWKARRAGAEILACIAEGCQTAMKPVLGDLLTFVGQFAVDESPEVRAAACWVLGQWAEHLQPEIFAFHADILPLIFALLADGARDVVRRACYVLECFLEHLPPRLVVPYLGHIVEQVETLIGCGDLLVEAQAVSALSSVAIAGKAAFVPHFERTATGLLSLMARTDEAGLSVRAMATDALGHIAVSIGRDAFAPALDESIRLAVEGASLGHIEVLEYTFSFFGNMANLLGGELAELVPDVFNMIKEVVQRRDAYIFDPNADSDDELSRFVEGVDEEVGAGDGDEGHAGAGGEDDPEASEAAELAEAEAARAFAKRSVARVRTSELDAKSGAMCCLGQMFQHCGACMEPILHDAYELVTSMSGYAHENVRAMCIYTLQELVKCAVQIEGLPEVAPGEVPHVGPTAQRYLNECFTLFLLRMQEEEDKGVVGHAVEAVRVWCVKIGDAAVANHLDTLIEVLKVLLEERAVCQYIDSEDEEHRDDDDEDHDSQLMDTVADLLGGLAHAFGAGFAEDFGALLPALLRFAKPVRPASDHAMVVGAFAEVAQGLGDAVVPFAGEMLAHIFAGLESEDVSLVRNSAFAVGAVLEAGGEALQEHVPTAVAALLGLAAVEGMDSAILDQICSSLSRLLMRHGKSGAVAVGDVLPVIVANLPLKDDHHEDEVVYRCVCTLLDAREASAMDAVPQLLAAFAQALGDFNVAQGIKDEIGARVAALATDFAQPTAEAIAMLPEEHQALLHAHVGAEHHAAA